MAYANGDLGLHALVWIRMFKQVDGEIKTKKVQTTVGRVIYNQGIPQDLGFVDRSQKENALKLEIDFPVIKKNLGTIVAKCINKHGFEVTAEVLDYIKSIGYKYSTKGAITVSVADVSVPDEKAEILEKAELEVDNVMKQYKRGLITNEERYQSTIKIWEKVTDEVTEAMKDNFDELNPIYMMAQSGARRKYESVKTDCRYAWSYG